MKKFFALFVAFMVCLSCFNSMVGAQNRGYKDSVNAVVSVVNTIGDVATAALSVFKRPSNLVSDLPDYYRHNFQLLVSQHEDCDSSCFESLAYYLRNRYYSDVKRYYLQLEGNMFNNLFESNVFRWAFAAYKRPDPDLVRDEYEKALLEGYPMDNPFIMAGDEWYSYECDCCK